MKITPPLLKTCNILDLNQGDLYIFDWHASATFAIKLIDQENTSNSYMLILGSSFPNAQSKLELVRELSSSCISLGSDYTLRLPIDPNEWIINEDKGERPDVMIKGSTVYMRVSYRESHMWVNLTKAELCQSAPININCAFARKWEIVIQDGDETRIIAKNHK